MPIIKLLFFPTVMKKLGPVVLADRCYRGLHFPRALRNRSPLSLTRYSAQGPSRVTRIKASEAKRMNWEGNALHAPRGQYLPIISLAHAGQAKTAGNGKLPLAGAEVRGTPGAGNQRRQSLNLFRWQVIYRFVARS